MREYKIAAIPADGIGPEVIAAGLQVLEALEQRSGDFKIHTETFDWGSDYYKKHGVMMPADGLDKLKKFDAIFFGAVGAPDVPDHITLWGLRLPICQGFDQYANVRPTKILPGITPPLRNCGPGDLDWVIVRENSEGEYSGHGGRAHPDVASVAAPVRDVVRSRRVRAGVGVHVIPLRCLRVAAGLGAKPWQRYGGWPVEHSCGDAKVWAMYVPAAQDRVKAVLAIA